jgi:NTP pyrophosphatase (non-canonical NTP hydrolase)
MEHKDFFNTTGEPIGDTKVYRAKATAQQITIYEFFRSHPREAFAPETVWKNLFKEPTPQSSIQRAITNLTTMKKLVKLPTKVIGKLGRPVHIWTLNQNQEDPPKQIPYEPYGEEWKDELMKLPKIGIIALYRALCLDYQEREEHNVQSTIDAISQWADGAFGKNRSPIAKMHHAKKECDEVIEALAKNDPDFMSRIIRDVSYRNEIADVFMIMFDVCAILKISSRELEKMIWQKLEINKTRKWGAPDENGVIEHIREQL